MQLKAIYTVAELAQMARIPSRRMHAVLRAEGVLIRKRNDRVTEVTISELERRVPDLWTALQKTADGGQWKREKGRNIRVA